MSKAVVANSKLAVRRYYLTMKELLQLHPPTALGFITTCAIKSTVIISYSYFDEAREKSLTNVLQKKLSNDRTLMASTREVKAYYQATKNKTNIASFIKSADGKLQEAGDPQRKK